MIATLFRCRDSTFRVATLDINVTTLGVDVTNLGVDVMTLDLMSSMLQPCYDVTTLGKCRGCLIIVATLLLWCCDFECVAEF